MRTLDPVTASLARRTFTPPSEFVLASAWAAGAATPSPLRWAAATGVAPSSAAPAPRPSTAAVGTASRATVGDGRSGQRRLLPLAATHGAPGRGPADPGPQPREPVGRAPRRRCAGRAGPPCPHRSRPAGASWSETRASSRRWTASSRRWRGGRGRRRQPPGGPPMAPTSRTPPRRTGQPGLSRLVVASASRSALRALRSGSVPDHELEHRESVAGQLGRHLERRRGRVVPRRPGRPTPATPPPNGQPSVCPVVFATSTPLNPRLHHHSIHP